MTDGRTSRVSRWGMALLLALSSTLLPAGCGDESGEEGGVSVMTQNVYVGFDVDPLLASQDPNEIPVLAAQAFAQLLSTNCPERAEAMADEIARKRPHLIGLQEVSLIRTQSPGDAALGGVVPAETVVFDYLEILRAALSARGLDYRVAGKIQNVDVELPMIVDPETFACDDIRLTDFDVVLARGDVETSNVTASNYMATLPLPSLGIEIRRGYVAVDAVIARRGSYRFASTHLEDTPFPEVQMAQARELAASLTGQSKPVILVGDFNSPAPVGEAYAYLNSLGYVDAWTRNARADQGAGLTWGHDSTLRNESDQFTQRIDLVLLNFSQAGLDPERIRVDAEVWGDERSERTSTGMWPSDHGAVLAEIGIATDRGRKGNR